MNPNEVLIYLRKRGVTVHLVSHGSGGGLTIYLEANLGQMEFADYLMRQLPAVKTVREISPGILQIMPKR